jgi:hypothetical protein
MRVQIRSRENKKYRWRTDFHMEYGEGLEVEMVILVQNHGEVKVSK